MNSDNYTNQFADETASLLRALRTVADDETVASLFPYAWRQLNRIRSRKKKQKRPIAKSDASTARQKTATDLSIDVTTEAIRMYHAVASGAGVELAEKMYPEVARHLARIDSGVRGNGQLAQE